MRGQAVSFLYVLNIVMQAFFSLLFTVAVLTGVGYLLVTFAGVGEWVYIPLILVGVAWGVISMVRFILVAMAGLDRLEKERGKRDQ